MPWQVLVFSFHQRPILRDVALVFAGWCVLLPVELRAQATGSESTTGIEETVQLARAELDRLAELPMREDRVAGLGALTAYIDQIRASDPANPWLLYLYGRMSALTGRDGDARDYLRKFIDTPEGRNEWTAYRTLGDLFSAEFPRLAKLNYTRARELRGDEASILYGLSVCEMKLANFSPSLQLAQEAVDADGRKTARYLAHLAQVHAARKEWKEAAAAAEAALRLAEEAMRSDPGTVARVQEADTHCQLLIEMLTLLITGSPREIDARLRLEQVKRRRIELASLLAKHEIVADLRSAVAMTEPDVPIRLRERYALALAEVERSEDARREFHTILETEPTNAFALEWLRLHPDTDSAATPP